MRFKQIFPVLAVVLAVAAPAGAVLKHYTMSWSQLAEFNTSSPQLNKHPPIKGGPQGLDAAFIDDTNNGSPVLKKLLFLNQITNTSNLPGLAGFLFLAMRSEQGPRKGTSFTGTGDTTSTIAWGIVTGWTVTGSFWCHSSPTYICGAALGKNLDTVDPMFNSPFYDLGTWTFHGTGFTSTPYINQVASQAGMSVGNNQYSLKGRISAGLVPALPVLGVALLGASLLIAGARLSRR